MAAVFSAVAEQLVLPNQPVVFTANSVPDTSGTIFANLPSGVFRLASLARRLFIGCACCRRPLETQYYVEFNANVSIPEGGTVAPITLAFYVDGVADPVSLIEVTPAAAGDYWAVSKSTVIAVPSICRCESFSVVNTAAEVTGVNVRNANLIINPVGVRAAG